MQQSIEFTVDTTDGVADCRAEMTGSDGRLSVTILYPNNTSGFNRSEVYCHDMYKERENYFFADAEEMHPKIKRLEAQISQAILQASQ